MAAGIVVWVMPGECITPRQPIMADLVRQRSMFSTNIISLRAMATARWKSWVDLARRSDKTRKHGKKSLADDRA
jgi:hypothetical protein